MTFSGKPFGKLMLASSVSALALAPSIVIADPAAKIADLASSGAYLSGDKHNHTTCTDGSMSVQTTVNESLITYDLDWFAQTGHGGEGNRDCRFDDPEYDGGSESLGQFAYDDNEAPRPGQITGAGAWWEFTIGAEGIKGDEERSTSYGAGAVREDGLLEMWRWQQTAEYIYPIQRQMAELADKPAWAGLEHNAPGHEHVSMSVYEGQLRARGDAYAVAQFEYLFDASDDDLSGGGEEYDFENPANKGIPKTTDDRNGIEGRNKAVASVEWLRANYPKSYYVPAHVERQGAFDPEGRRGWNVEDFRLLYNAGLLDPADPDGESIAFGAEMLAGHQFANGGRGTYELDRPSAGFGTYGGAGAYSGAEVTVPGQAFDGGEANIATNAFLPDGSPVTINVPTDGEALEVSDLEAIAADFDAVFEGRLTEPSGSDQFDSFRTDLDLVRYTLGRPGVQTMWDAMLGEGRKFWNFSSSDWHNRGAFGPWEPQSTLDPWPGEYNKIYAYAEGGNVNAGFNQNAAEAIIDGMRRGNTYSVHGDLITDFYWAICQGDTCATLGEELQLTADGGDLEWVMRITDPSDTNNSPYAFNNPSLLPLGIEIPMNAPVLDRVDIILGEITGIIPPEDPAFSTNVANPSTVIFASLDRAQFTQDGDVLEISSTIPLASITGDVYLRVRGTNMPVGTPNETDAAGNPLLDDFASLIECPFLNPEPGAFDPEFCPEHLPRDAQGRAFLDADVEAWADLWFYTSPIFVRAPE